MSFEVLKQSNHELEAVAEFEVYAGTHQWILRILGEMQSLVPLALVHLLKGCDFWFTLFLIVARVPILQVNILLIPSQCAVSCQNMLPINLITRFRGNILKLVTNVQEVIALLDDLTILSSAMDSLRTIFLCWLFN